MTDRSAERRREDRPYLGPDQRQSRRDEVEAWWYFLARILAFMLGAIIVGFNLVVSDAEGSRLWLAILIGVGLMWPIVGPGVTQAVAVLRGGGDRGGA